MIKNCQVNIRTCMDSQYLIRIVFLTFIILSCLTVYYLFGKGSTEGFFLKEQIVNFKDDGTPVNPVYDEYGNPLTDGYYFAPIVEGGKWTTGTKDYKQYTLKSLPYGYKALPDKKSIMPVTIVQRDTDGILDKENILPEWRELTFAEYSAIPSIPAKDIASIHPPSGFFNIKKTDYENAKIPINHDLLGPDTLNPNYTYLKYTGPQQDIPGYNYSYNIVGKPDNTGEFVKDTPGTIMAPGNGKYKIKLVQEYNANDTPKKVKYVIADIPVGLLLDSTDPTFTKLLTDLTKYNSDNAANAPTLHPDFTDTDTAASSPPPSAENGGIYYQYDQTGKLVEIEYKDSNFAPTLYYMPGTYKFGSSAYVPNYEDSVYLSRMTREAQMMPGANPNGGGAAPVFNTSSQLGGFCNADKDNKMKLEEKCNAVEPGSCASTSCCVLLGGQKCVAGNESGPLMTANYTDYTLRNKDFYYYQGKCYGNCANA